MSKRDHCCEMFTLGEELIFNVYVRSTDCVICIHPGHDQLGLYLSWVVEGHSQCFTKNPCYPFSQNLMHCFSDSSNSAMPLNWVAPLWAIHFYVSTYCWLILRNESILLRAQYCSRIWWVSWASWLFCGLDSVSSRRNDLWNHWGLDDCYVPFLCIRVWDGRAFSSDKSTQLYCSIDPFTKSFFESTSSDCHYISRGILVSFFNIASSNLQIIWNKCRAQTQLTLFHARTMTQVCNLAEASVPLNPTDVFDILFSDCWICSPFSSPNSTPATQTIQSHVDSHLDTPTSGPSSSQSQRGLGSNPCGRLTEYRRKSYLDQAQKRLTSSIQNKRRSEFRQLREALYLLSNYAGPYLQSPGDKKKAAYYLRSHNLGVEFVNEFDNEVKWEWLNNQIVTSPRKRRKSMRNHA